MRLDAYLTGELDDVSRADVQRWIRSGRVSANGERVVRPAAIVAVGDTVEIRLPPPASLSPAPRPIAFTVVHADADLLIVDKPAGLPVHPGAGHEDDTLVNGLLHRYPQLEDVGEPDRPGIVHRLDRDTSGLLAVALTAEAYPALAEAVREHRMDRRYTALVWGLVSSEEGVVDAPIGRDPRRPRRQRVAEDGRESRTRYRVVRKLPSTTLLDVAPETGRMHQIRVHLAAIGYPVVGDRTYGRRGYGLERQFLHASSLALDHPVSGDRVEAASPLPPDLEGALARAEAAADE